MTQTWTRGDSPNRAESATTPLTGVPIPSTTLQSAAAAPLMKGQSPTRRVCQRPLRRQGLEDCDGEEDVCQVSLVQRNGGANITTASLDNEAPFSTK